MQGAAMQPARRSALAAAVDLARREPAKVLAVVLGLHLLVWTLLPILVCANLQLDLVEDLALGKEWQLGYWKPPPLPWWASDLLYRLVGDVRAVYLLGPLSAVICFYVVWRLGREIVGAFEALLAVLVLEGIHFYNFSVVKFAHDQMQLPFWALTALFFYRGIVRGGAFDWILAGLFLALAFWTKYAAFALAAALGLFLLFDPAARRAWRTPGPYLMALAFAVVIAPNVWWLLGHDLMPLRYVDERARVAGRWYHYIVFPLRWTASQLVSLLPAVGLLALLLADGERARPGDDMARFNRRYVTMLALGPFAVTTVVAVALGRLPVAMWGYPLWSFAPLAALLWIRPVFDARRPQWFAGAFLTVVVAIPVIYAAVEIGEPFVRDRSKATQFPGQVLAETLTREWREKFGTPLTYVGGTEFAVNNVAVYSPDRPHAIVHGNPKLSGWIDPNDLRRRGAILVWEDGLGERFLDQWRATFPTLDIQPALVLARQTWHPVRPVRVLYAFVAPQP